MARIAYADRDRLAPETREFLDRLAPMNIFRMMAHAETVFPKYVRMGNALLTRGRLDPMLREMAIVRVGHLSGAGYEVHQHERISRDLGMPEDKLAALAEGPQAPAFSDLERLVLRFTDEVVGHVRAPDEIFNALSKELEPTEMVELVLTIGYYMMTSRFLENFDVDIEDGGEPLRLSR